MKYRLFGKAGWGSAIIEAALELAGIPYEVEEVDPSKADEAQARLRALNPLLQLPTLLAPDGTVLTESAAMVLHLSDRAPEAGLVPPPDAASRVRFLRWLMFLVAAVYPTFTYGDEPSRYVSTEAAQKELRASTDRLRERLFRQLDEAALGPWFLGDALSAIDLYIWVMGHWRPGRAWFEASCPKLWAIAAAIDADPRFARVRARNFP